MSEAGGVSDRHPVEIFFEWVEELPLELYPDSLVPVAGRHIDGVSGFPAGRGLYAECGWDHAVAPPFPFGGLMLVGNHLDAEEAYLEKLALGSANGDPCPDAPRMRFWTMLYATLDRAGIPRHDIFVTNVHPALIRGRRPTGVVVASDAWLRACAELLERQIDVMRPRAIAALGAPARTFLERMLGVSWARVPDLVTTHLDGRPTAVAAIRHPSAAQSHAHRDRTVQVLREAFGTPPR